MDKKKIFRVIISLNHSKSVLDYCYSEDLQIGQVVSVDVRGKKYLAVIYQKNPTIDFDLNKLKSISSIHSGFILPEMIMFFIERLSNYSLSNIGGVLKLFLSSSKILEKKYTSFLRVISKEIPKSKRGKELVGVLDNNLLNKSTILEQFSSSVINTLLKNKVIEEVQKEIIDSQSKYDFKIPELNSEQQKAFDQITRFDLHNYISFLLAGVTGSGKTEVYLKLIEKIFSESKGQFLILMPEIFLTQKMLSRIADRVGATPYIWHSSSSVTQKREIFQKAIRGEDIIVIGARSSLFLPFKKLSLIIVDEEHDSSYKQEEGVIYNARDAAVLLANTVNCPILLSSATPSLETYNNVLKNRYNLIEIKHRHKGVELPEVLVEDLKNSKLSHENFISHNLRKVMNEELDRGKQVLLFLNRKGYSPITLCVQCGYSYKCPDCSTSLVYYQSESKYVCHYCGVTKKLTSNCPSCDAKDSMRYCGAGVEKIQDEVKKYFPDKRFAVLTSDSSKGKEYQKILEDIEDLKVDIIIGTQVIGKGYHFKNISLVGVVDADVGLLDADLRSGEKTFQVISQVVGRSGREEKGKALIQTYYPANMLIKSVIAGDYKKFYDYELQHRFDAELPPFSRLIAIIISSNNQEHLQGFVQEIAKKIPYSDKVTVLGPIKAPIFKIQKKFRYRVLIKSDLQTNIQAYVKQWLKNMVIPHNIMIKIDVDPYNFL